MLNRRLDENWDYTFGQGKQCYLTGAEAVAQAIKSRLWLLYREWWEDLDDGLPLWERILGSNGGPANIAAVDGIFRDRIEKTPDVVAVVSYNSDFTDRRYSFTCLVNTKYGMITVTNEEGSAWPI